MDEKEYPEYPEVTKGSIIARQTRIRAQTEGRGISMTEAQKKELADLEVQYQKIEKQEAEALVDRVRKKYKSSR